MPEEDEQSQAGRNWLSTLNEARVNCREKVATAMVSVPNPDKALWPVRSRRQMTEAHEAAMQAHVSVIDYADQLTPYQDERGVDEEMWQETLATPTVAGDELEISLANLQEWEFEFYRIEWSEMTNCMERQRTSSSTAYSSRFPVCERAIDS